MADLVLDIRVEDHVSPLLKAISASRFLRSADLPPFPRNLVAVEAGAGPANPFIRMLPSADLLDWLATVIAQVEVKR